MRVLPHSNPSLFILEGASGHLVDYVRMSIQPVRDRRYDVATRQWTINILHLPDVVALAENEFGFIDYSLFPDDVQIALAHNKRVILPKKETNPFTVMHLLPTAPLAIVDATFRALVKIHHPDCGGNAEEFKSIVDAYDRIKQSVERDHKKEQD